MIKPCLIHILFSILQETNILRPINNVQKLESALNSSFRSINLKSDDYYNKVEVNLLLSNTCICNV